MHIPRFIISALSGGGGKTLLSLGLTRAFTKIGQKVKTYKKGPDYIDAHWLALASKELCTNLDPFFLNANQLQALFTYSYKQNHPPFSLALIEGNRGLFDGQDKFGSCSTAELARTIKTPVILSLNVTKVTRTTVALLQGVLNFEKDLQIVGVVLNQVGSIRHEKIIRECIEHYTNIPVLGALPRLKTNPLPERHMGLSQHHNAENTLNDLGNFIIKHCNLEKIYNLANQATSIPISENFWDSIQEKDLTEKIINAREINLISSKLETKKSQKNKTTVRIGYLYDDAFWFYYAENLQALEIAGAELVPLSFLDNTPWPDNLHGLYLGGGYPEEFLEEISKSKHLEELRNYSLAHMPIYAECGGFMILANAIIRNKKSYAMANIFPVKSEFFPKPQGLGYTMATVQMENIFHPLNQELRGHEFHYSKCLDIESYMEQDEYKLCLSLNKGLGMGKYHPNNPSGFDGLYIRHTFASYTHIFAPSCPWWANNFVKTASNFAQNIA